MAHLALDYDGLKKKASKITTQKDQFETLLNQVMATIKEVDNVWKDKAATEFIDKITSASMRKNFAQFGEALGNLSLHMNNVAIEYEKLSTNISNAQKF
ncbi:WXG100 family type VII secretion target [Paenibacillus oenotherae]|uniref:WXG100 family type VII secretion target n=1 Tax=Paenibacillus oenotherae TaxID=1435645 RepID=A0ABS7D5J5_9BACL|nr:WXG100 family type VII secretion target [Paenibacillus oenotherae]MBW7475217.1 WXG100 family type VII secretion target [Paenibacillus oenotherae]